MRSISSNTAVRRSFPSLSKNLKEGLAMGWINHDPEALEMTYYGWHKAKALSLIREAQALWKKALDEGTDSDAFYDLQIVLYEIEDCLKEGCHAGEKEG